MPGNVVERETSEKSDLARGRQKGARRQQVIGVLSAYEIWEEIEARSKQHGAIPNLLGISENGKTLGFI
jgi:hypothetical protein